MELKDSLANFVEAVVMSLGSPSLSSTLAAFDPEDAKDNARS